MKEQPTNKDKNMPVKKFPAGAISATVWMNTEKNHEGKDFMWYTVSICRNYTLDNGKTWMQTDSYRINDLPKVRLVAEQAYEYLATMKKPSSEDQETL